MNARTKSAAQKKTAASKNETATATDGNAALQVAPEQTTAVPLPNVEAVKPGDLKPLAFLHDIWATVMPGEIDPETLDNPGYWRFARNRFKAGDEVWVTADNMAWRAWLIVTAVEHEIKVRIRDIVELEERTEREIDVGPYLVRNCGMIKRFCVIRKDDGKELKTGLRNQIEAIQYATDQINANR